MAVKLFLKLVKHENKILTTDESYIKLFWCTCQYKWISHVDYYHLLPGPTPSFFFFLMAHCVPYDHSSNKQEIKEAVS